MNTIKTLIFTCSCLFLNTALADHFYKIDFTKLDLEHCFHNRSWKYEDSFFEELGRYFSDDDDSGTIITKCRLKIGNEAKVDFDDIKNLKIVFSKRTGWSHHHKKISSLKNSIHVYTSSIYNEDEAENETSIWIDFQSFALSPNEAENTLANFLNSLKNEDPIDVALFKEEKYKEAKTYSSAIVSSFY